MRNIIKVSREEAKISQEEYAKMFGISRKTLSEIENGKTIPNLDLAYKMAAYYTLPVEDVFENPYRFKSKMQFDEKEVENER